MSAVQRLILSIEGERTSRLGGRREQEFDGCDGSIGRSDECDWVLSAEGVSRLHAQVRYLNGLYFIEDRSTNGMSLNGEPLRKGDPAALKQGDRLQIDTFEVSVRLSGDGATELHARAGSSDTSPVVAPSATSSPSTTPASGPNKDALDLSLLLAPQRAAPSSEHVGEAEGLIPGVGDGAAHGASLDPLALFDAPSSYVDEPLPHVSSAPGWNHTPAAADRFRPPQAEAARLDGPVLPEDWDATASLVAARSRIVQAPPAEDASMTAAGRATPSPEPQPAPGEAAEHAAPVQQTQPAMPTQASPQNALPDTTPSVIAAALASPAAALPQAPQAPQAVQTPQTPQASTTPTPEAPAPATPEPDQASPELHAMFHIAVDAMMDVLRARAELKNSFRLPATLIQRSENNPLKFAPTAQEAVKRLLAPPDGGFLSGSAALNDAADDIRNHQMAMLAGVRSAFQSLLAHFDPARIEQETGSSVRRLPLGGRPRHWERYKEQFEAVTRNPDECFRRLFGDEFARAYEEQLGRLKKRRN